MKTDTNNYLTFYNYKEPLKEVKDGYGYYGTLAVSKDGHFVQCHICGELFANLSMHIFNGHKMKPSVYKEKYGLARSTALISESERSRLKEIGKANFLNWYSKKTPEEKRQMALNSQKKHKHEKFKIRLETKNKRGTCPDQLLAKITEVKDKIGKTPTLAEFITETGGQRYKHLIFTTFGSWKNALKMLKLTPRVVEHKGKKKPRYSDEELLEYLSIYTQENRRVPTATDSKRKMIPEYDTYTRRFGSFEKARQLAGVYQIIN